MTLGQKKASYLKTLCAATQARRKTHPHIHTQESHFPVSLPFSLGQV